MSNPVLNEKMLEKERVLDSEPMTVNGSINKTFISFACLFASSLFVWNLYSSGFMDKATMFMGVGLVLGFILAMGICFNFLKSNTWSIAVPAYAVMEGFALGGISAQFEHMYPGIVIQAVGATFMALFSVLVLFRTGTIKCTEKFRSVMLNSVLAIAGIYIVAFIGSFFGLHIPQLFTSSPIGIGFSAVVCIIASLNLIVDFDFIERGAQNMLGKSYEWYGAFGLMVTLVWLYIEILNLLAKLRDR